MQDIANAILEGSDGYFSQQYMTIGKLSVVFAAGIMLIYFSRESNESEMAQTIPNYFMAIVSGLSFMVGAICSGFSGYAGNLIYLQFVNNV